MNKLKSKKKIASCRATRGNHSTPSSIEINALVNNFNEGRYEIAKNFALTMTQSFPQHFIGWKALGAILIQIGNMQEALSPSLKAVELMPRDAEAHNNLGNVLRQLGRHEEALACCRQAIAIKPDFAEAHCNLGVELRELGRLEEAEASFRRAISFKPSYAEVHSNLGNTLRDLHRPEEAEVSYRQAIALKPGYAEAHNNLGNALRELDRLEEAEASYRHSLALKPGYAEAHYNLGNALSDLGRFEEAEASCRQAIKHKPDYMRAKAAYAVLVSSMRFRSITPSVYEAITTALSEVWTRPSMLSKVACNLLLLNQLINKLLVPGRDMRSNSKPVLYDSDTFQNLGDDPLLLALMTSAPIPNVQLEDLLTKARLILLDTALEGTREGSIHTSELAFFCALAHQCFINEYVFSYSEEEIQQANRLKTLLAGALKIEREIPPLWVVAVACYCPLFSIDHSEALLECTWPTEINGLLKLQIAEPLEELRLRLSIPMITPISDGVSAAVQGQYEENPYPRWIRAPKEGAPKPINVFLNQLFPNVEILPIVNFQSPDILIAGCGTGQHPIQTAQNIGGASVLAIDLSSASLSYAKRKTQEMGICNINYAQADILKLDRIGRTFDVIESVGVLHHLARPFDAWRLLASLLRPNGLMKLGFYSEIARRDVVKVRNLISQKCYGSTPSDIRKARQWLLEMDRTDGFGNAVRSADFYSLSGCRDLLFHVKEHRMTLKQINEFIVGNDLVFLGFEFSTPSVTRAYKLRFPDDRAATNLANWHQYEQENSDIFFGMYQFWVQKGT